MICVVHERLKGTDLLQIFMYTEVLDKNTDLHSLWFRGLNTCFFFYSISQCSLWAPSHTLQHRGDWDHHCDYMDTCPRLALRYIADVPNLLWYSPLVPSCFWICKAKTGRFKNRVTWVLSCFCSYLTGHIVRGITILLPPWIMERWIEAVKVLCKERKH